MKTVLVPAHVLVAQSMATSFNTNAMAIEQADVVGIQMNYSGSPVGTLALQGSIDHAQDQFGNITNAGNWTSLYVTVNGTLTNAIAIPANTSPILIDTSLSSLPYFRLSYTAISGTGSADVYLTSKRLGD